LLQVSEDEMWVGSYDGGIRIINENKGTVKHLTYRHKLSANNIQSYDERQQRTHLDWY
jgi:hypothetical protein